jgi:hypothetical protein
MKQLTIYSDEHIFEYGLKNRLPRDGGLRKNALASRFWT